jgi:hypothetical protein
LATVFGVVLPVMLLSQPHVTGQILLVTATSAHPPGLFHPASTRLCDRRPFRGVPWPVAPAAAVGHRRGAVPWRTPGVVGLIGAFTVIAGIAVITTAGATRLARSTVLKHGAWYGIGAGL